MDENTSGNKTKNNTDCSIWLFEYVSWKLYQWTNL